MVEFGRDSDISGDSNSSPLPGPNDGKYGVAWRRKRDYRNRRRYPKEYETAIRIVGELAFVPLSGGQWATIDATDADRVRGRVWFTSRSSGGIVYAASNNPKTRMHRLILGAKPGQVVDHANGNGLDNRRCNIRICTASQNSMNMRKPSHGKTTAFKGVCLISDRAKKKYRASIKNAGKARHIGYFATAEEAARAYDAAALQHFGEFARLNFPTPREPAHA